MTHLLIREWSGACGQIFEKTFRIFFRSDIFLTVFAGLWQSYGIITTIPVIMTRSRHPGTRIPADNRAKKNAFMDSVTRYCTGEDEQFAGVPCHGYNRKERECAYLRAGELQTIFTHGHCPSTERIRKIVENTLKTSMQGDALWKYQNPTDHVEALTFLIVEHVFTRKTGWTENYTLPAWYAYLRQTVPYRVRDLLEESGDVEKRHCGHCVHLSQDQPFRCERRMLRRNSHSNEADIPNPRFRQLRQPLIRACRDGFESWFAGHAEQELADFPASNIGDELELDILLHNCRTVLENRYVCETGAKRKIYKRHFLSFTRMVQLCLNEGVERLTALHMIAEEWGKSRKQLNRDFSAILEFLRAQNVLPRRNGNV